MRKRCKYCNEEAVDNKDLCLKHLTSLEVFYEKKKDIYAIKLEDMRVIERMVKLNPDLIRCPICNEPLEINHWKKEENVLKPYFKCKKCGFIG